MKIINITITLLLAFTFLGCDKGLEPPDEQRRAILVGKVNFINNWPKQDSVFGIRAAAFKLPPSQNLLDEIKDGNAFFKLESLGYNVESAEFQFEIDELPVTLKYIIIAWQYESDISKERVIGVYTLTNKSNPAEIILTEGDSTFIEIEVDWNDFPPQPF